MVNVEQGSGVGRGESTGTSSARVESSTFEWTNTFRVEESPPHSVGQSFVSITTGFNPGSLGVYPNGHRYIEDRGFSSLRPDGGVIAGVVDGVGETYVGQETRRFYRYGDRDLCLGDIPGRILVETLREAQIDSESAIRAALGLASERYGAWLSEHGLDEYATSQKHLIGGCTFAVAVHLQDGSVFLVSGGDAVCVAIMPNGDRIGTRNQLPEVNQALEPSKRYLYETFGPKDGRALFNAMWKEAQRNQFTNGDGDTVVVNRAEIIDRFRREAARLSLTDTLVEESIPKLNVPERITPYAFFDGDRRVSRAAQVLRLEGTPTKVLMVTDGCFNSSLADPVPDIAETIGAAGVEGLLRRNESKDGTGGGPEATVVVVAIDHADRLQQLAYPSMKDGSR